MGNGEVSTGYQAVCCEEFVMSNREAVFAGFGHGFKHRQARRGLFLLALKSEALA
jgi:hypothetical protein